MKAFRVVCACLAVVFATACEISFGVERHPPAPAAPRAPAPAVAPAAQPAPVAQPSAAPSAAPRITRVTGGPAAVEGKLAVKRVEEIIARHHNELRFCQESGVTVPDRVEGKVKLVVSPKGAVQEASLEEVSVQDARLTDCVVGAAKRWTFGAVPGGKPAVVTYPVLLDRVEG